MKITLLKETNFVIIPPRSAGRFVPGSQAIITKR